MVEPVKIAFEKDGVQTRVSPRIKTALKCKHKKI